MKRIKILKFCKAKDLLKEINKETRILFKLLEMVGCNEILNKEK